MKVLIDIAHPAHIHYFRNFAKIFESKGHKVLFTLRDKGIIRHLADYYKLNYIIRSKEAKVKAIYIFKSILNIYRISRKFKPDIFFDMGTVVAAPIAKLLGKPYIAFDDTEASTKARLLHMPFTDVILTPKVFYKELGLKQIRVDSLMELMYLSDKYFFPDREQVDRYIDNKRNFVLIRFVSWEAHHDVGQNGINYKNKRRLINLLSDEYSVVISSEGTLPDEFEKYRFKPEPHLMHHFLKFASLVITEGATIASEAVVLGTPTIYFNTILNGYNKEQIQSGLLLYLNNNHGFIEAVSKFINNQVGEEQLLTKKKDYLKTKIDFTKFLVWFIENYPQSAKYIKENIDYQYNFR